MSQFHSQSPIGTAAPSIKPSVSVGIKPSEAEPMELVDDTYPGTGAAPTENKIRAITGNDTSHRKETFKRQPVKTGTGACRVRSFHGRLSTQGLEFLDNQINDWLSDNAEVEVKFVTSTVGVFEGKMREPAMILNLWY